MYLLNALPVHQTRASRAKTFPYILMSSQSSYQIPSSSKWDLVSFAWRAFLLSSLCCVDRHEWKGGRQIVIVAIGVPTRRICHKLSFLVHVRSIALMTLIAPAISIARLGSFFVCSNRQRDLSTEVAYTGPVEVGGRLQGHWHCFERLAFTFRR